MANNVEITRVIEAKITIIEKMPKDDAETILSYKSEAENNVKKTMQQLYTPDDVHVEIHDFVRDVEE